MSRIVITTWGSYGDLYPFIGLALALRDHGQEPVLAMSAAYREIVEREGPRFIPMRQRRAGDRELAARVMDPGRTPCRG